MPLKPDRGSAADRVSGASSLFARVTFAWPGPGRSRRWRGTRGATCAAAGPSGAGSVGTTGRIRSRLEPIRRVARIIRNYWDAVTNAAVSGISSANAEGFNATIQKIKRRANGYRNRENFRLAIYFHLGGPDMTPESLRAQT